MRDFSNFVLQFDVLYATIDKKYIFETELRETRYIIEHSSSKIINTNSEIFKQINIYSIFIYIPLRSFM